MGGTLSHPKHVARYYASATTGSSLSYAHTQVKSDCTDSNRDEGAPGCSRNGSGHEPDRRHRMPYRSATVGHARCTQRDFVWNLHVTLATYHPGHGCHTVVVGLYGLSDSDSRSTVSGDWSFEGQATPRSHGSLQHSSNRIRTCVSGTKSRKDWPLPYGTDSCVSQQETDGLANTVEKSYDVSSAQGKPMRNCMIYRLGENRYRYSTAAVPLAERGSGNERI